MPIKQEELELWKKYKHEGDKQAKQQLIESLKPLIRSQVNKYKNSGLPVASLELEGIKLADKAIETYNPSKAQLNTHVMNYLKKLSRFTTNYQNVGHIPEPRSLQLGRYKTIKSNLEAEKGREPTASELADAMHLPEREIERIEKEDRSDLQMEMPSEDEGGFYEYIIEEEQQSPEEEALDFVYFDSDPINKKIMEYTFGIKGGMKKTFGDMKQELGLSDTELRRRRKQIAEEIRELTG